MEYLKKLRQVVKRIGWDISTHPGLQETLSNLCQDGSRTLGED